MADRHGQVYSPTVETTIEELEIPRKDEVHYRVQCLFDQHFIPLDSTLRANENEWYSQERTPNGDILLRLNRTNTP